MRAWTMIRLLNFCIGIVHLGVHVPPLKEIINIQVIVPGFGDSNLPIRFSTGHCQIVSVYVAIGICHFEPCLLEQTSKSICARKSTELAWHHLRGDEHTDPRHASQAKEVVVAVDRRLSNVVDVPNFEASALLPEDIFHA